MRFFARLRPPRPTGYRLEPRPPGPRLPGPSRRARIAAFLRDHEEILLYAVAAVAYIAIGLAAKQALAWMIEAAIFLWLTVWLLPDAIRWAWRRRR